MDFSPEKPPPAKVTESACATKTTAADAEPAPRHHDGDFRLYFEHKMENLDAQRAALRDNVDVLPDQIFKNFIVYINGHPGKTPKHLLIEMLILRGAKIIDWPNKHTTHEIATSLNWRKVEKRSAPGMRFQRHVVTSDWVTESVKANKRLLERRFRPDILLNKAGVKAFGNFLTSPKNDTSEPADDAQGVQSPELSKDAGAHSNQPDPPARSSAATAMPLQPKHHGGSRRTYFENKDRNLREQRLALRAEGPLPDQIFHNVIAYINGDTGDIAIDDLTAMLVKGGAEIQDWPNKTTTHEIASSLNWRKIEKRLAPGQRFQRHVVTSAWVAESVKAGKRLREHKFVPDFLKSKHGLKAFSKFTANELPAADASAPKEQLNSSSMPLNSRTNCNHPEFVKGFFEQSRLHLIGTVYSTCGTAIKPVAHSLNVLPVVKTGSWRDIWKRAVHAFRQQQQASISEHDGGAAKSLPGSLYQQLLGAKSIGGAKSNNDGSFYVHIDMDCFFASVALLRFPKNDPIHTKPVVVAHTGRQNSPETYDHTAKANTSGGGRQEVSSANYVARRYGIRAGCSVARARAKIKEYCDKEGLHGDSAPTLVRFKLCFCTPASSFKRCSDVVQVVLPYPFEKINSIAEQVYTIFLSHCPPNSIEVRSIDEAYIRIVPCAPATHAVTSTPVETTDSGDVVAATPQSSGELTQAAPQSPCYDNTTVNPITRAR